MSLIDACKPPTDRASLDDNGGAVSSAIVAILSARVSLVWGGMMSKPERSPLAFILRLMMIQPAMLPFPMEALKMTVCRACEGVRISSVSATSRGPVPVRLPLSIDQLVKFKSDRDRSNGARGNRPRLSWLPMKFY